MLQLDRHGECHPTEDGVQFKDLPTSIILPSQEYLGISARDLLVTERGVQQSLMFVNHIPLDQDLSKLLQIGLEWFQIEAGIARPILECPTLKIPYT